jgi:hypothetical protein
MNNTDDTTDPVDDTTDPCLTWLWRKYVDNTDYNQTET